MRIAIAGAGIGGMTLAGLLAKDEHDVVLVEKAGSFGEVGAGIQISPNGSRVLAELGLADELARIGTMPARIVLRRWQDDRELMSRPQGSQPIERYGHPYYNVYRPDLIDLLATTVSGVETMFGAEVIGARPFDSGRTGAALELADGSLVEADVVIGADGIHSPVRTSVFGATPSRFSRSVAYRALVPREAVPDLAVEVTNRMGPDRHFVSYFVGEGQRYLNLVCVVPEAEWDVEGWNEPGSLDELRANFADWSAEVNAILDHVAEPVYRWALHDREPMPAWVAGPIALLGDACHAMLPFMAQGACQAIEDAAILRRVLAGDPPDVAAALAVYEAVRQPRAAELQRRSLANATTYHLPDGPDQRRRDEVFAGAMAGPDGRDPFEWLYRYDALTVELSQ